MKKLPFVEVHWRDAVSKAEWTSEGDLPAPKNVVSRGWLAKKDRHSVVVAHTVIEWDDGRDFGGVLTIPRGMVKRVRVMERGG